MDKYKKYYGVGIFLISAIILISIAYRVTAPRFDELASVSAELEKKTQELEQKKQEKQVVENKITKIKNSVASSQKKIYSPLESDLGNDTLFFTLYNDLIEMVHTNSVKIKSLDYTYNPQKDAFIEFSKDVYFVCDVNMELVSNYINLGKFIQDLYQYPYYIKINQIDVKPFAKDKTILISNLNLRLYAHTAPQSEQDEIIPVINKDDKE